MLETLKEIDTQWFLWINSHHTTALDWTMWTLSQHWSWAVVIVLAFVLLTLRQEPRRWWLVAVGVVLCFLLADQGSVLIKDTVCRLRPCHALEDVRMFRTHCGGQYGFVSSHAANAFAVALFFVLRYWKRLKRQWPLLLLIVWALATSYSRAYLGKHYPGDLVCGAILGCIIALIVWWLTDTIEKKLRKSETK
ncbi:MAG: phosphatase PAP2 family protein [Bacteroidales bacterium]|nr:phosphatase PAP2 family protein [Bacteroidales bacterium]